MGPIDLSLLNVKGGSIAMGHPFAATGALAQDVAREDTVIVTDAGNAPLVWVLPLALYLATFILAFADEDRVPGWVRRLWPHVAAVGIYFYTRPGSEE